MSASLTGEQVNNLFSRHLVRLDHPWLLSWSSLTGSWHWWWLPADADHWHLLTSLSLQVVVDISHWSSLRAPAPAPGHTPAPAETSTRNAEVWIRSHPDQIRKLVIRNVVNTAASAHLTASLQSSHTPDTSVATWVTCHFRFRFTRFLLQFLLFPSSSLLLQLSVQLTHEYTEEEEKYCDDYGTHGETREPRVPVSWQEMDYLVNSSDDWQDTQTKINNELTLNNSLVLREGIKKKKLIIFF